MRERSDTAGWADAPGRAALALQRLSSPITTRSASAFSRRGSTDEMIAMAVRRYVRYRLSYADVAEWLTERGLSVDRSTIYR